MTVGELIERLQEFDHAATVRIIHEGWEVYGVDPTSVELGPGDGHQARAGKPAIFVEIK